MIEPVLETLCEVRLSPCTTFTRKVVVMNLALLQSATLQSLSFMCRHNIDISIRKICEITLKCVSRKKETENARINLITVVVETH